MPYSGPVLSIAVHSPTEGVIGVKIDHFKHIDQTPSIALFPDAPSVPSVQLSRGAESDGASRSWSLATGGLTAEITENPYTIAFKENGRTLTTAGYKHQGFYDVPYKWTLRSASHSSCLETDVNANPSPGTVPEFVRYVHSELNLSPGELVYGLGEQFGAFVKNGECLESNVRGFRARVELH